MNDVDIEGDRSEQRGKSDAMKQRNAIRTVLERAIKRVDERPTRVESTHTPETSSKADAAIQKLREDRRLSREELDRPVTI